MEKIDKSIYIKKVGKMGKISIWTVNGEKVRKNLDEEFTNFGQHFRFKVIPEYEFWLDREAQPNERRFFVNHLLTEWKLMKNGMTFSKAIDIADAKEEQERKRTRDLKRILTAHGAPSSKKVHSKLLCKMKKISIWLINGRLVRSDFDIDFTEGGHDLVYNFVPKNEVWLDDDIISEERPYVLLHELFERSLMAKGLSYHQAHRRASKLEWGSRHDEKKLIKSLALLGWKKPIKTITK
ncbi:MAG: hypothetical protein WC459_02870 [Patescibacteria group bacterium]